MKEKTVGIIGAGSWGTALATVLCDNGHKVKLWMRNEAQKNEINTHHTNEKYLPGITLSEKIIAFTSLEEFCEDIEIIVIAVPTSAIREMIKKIAEIISNPIPIVHVSKGIEPDTLLRISEMIEEEAPKSLIKDLIVLSGPSHAEEVVQKHPTTVVVSSKNLQAAEEIQDLFMNQYFRVYTNPDLIGIEIGGALKNIIALAAGISDGLGYGDNAKAALITRGLAEISRLGTKMGANPLTFSGLAGIGDLVVTCTSVHSRNWKAGYLLGQGKSVDEVLQSMNMVVEGIRTTKAAYQLSKKYNCPMPITEMLYKTLFEDMRVQEAESSLMGRLKTGEMEELVQILNVQMERR